MTPKYNHGNISSGKELKDGITEVLQLKELKKKIMVKYIKYQIFKIVGKFAFGVNLLT